MAAKGYVYFGEAAGGRIIRSGVGVAQVGDPYQLQFQSWDDRPMGEDGACIVRWLTALIRHTNGYNVRVTPVVDGLSVAPSSFQGGPPAAGQDGVERLRVWPMQRGARVSAIVESLALPGPLELIDVEYSYAPIRTGR